MVNDTSTLNGALQELGETMASNLQAKGVTASASDGLTTLAGKILTIPAGSCYHIEFSEDSYTAVGGSATLEIYLQENYAPKSGATVTVTGSDSSLYTGITNNNGVASVTVSVSAETTFTATYSNATATCTVNAVSYLFRDGGVTGDVNTNYTDLNGTINTVVSNDGTNISCSTYADCYRRANVLLTGDFKITATFVSWYRDSCDMALLNTSNSRVYYFGKAASANRWNNDSSIITIYKDPVNDSPFSIERVGSTVTVKANGSSVCTHSVTTSDVYFAWKTHSEGGRNFTFKDLTIEQL